MAELNFNTEVGFIFFDYLATMQELQQNIEFIEATEIYKSDSRIFGTMRVQEGSPYVVLAKQKGLLGRKNQSFLKYDCRFIHKDVAEVEAIYKKWEASTLKLIKLLPLKLRLKSYRMDFDFIKELIKCYLDKNRNNLKKIISEHIEERHKYLLGINRWLYNKSQINDVKLLKEYLTDALRLNNENIFNNNFLI